MDDKDTIYRQGAIDIVMFECGEWTGLAKEISKQLKQLPSAQPEIVRCKECLMHGVCRFEQGLGLNGYCSQAKRSGG